MFRLARTPIRSEWRPSARPFIMFFVASRETFAFLSICLIRVSDVQTCDEPTKKRMKTFRKTLHNVFQGLQRNVFFSLCEYNRSLWCSDLRGHQQEVKTLHNVLLGLQRNVCFSPYMYNKSLQCSDLRGPQQEANEDLQQDPAQGQELQGIQGEVSRQGKIILNIKIILAMIVSYKEQC